MEIKFDVYFKKNLGTLCKDNEVDLDGKEAYINLDLSLVDRLEVNYSVGGTKYTDEVTIKDIDNKEILIPFKSDVVKKGLNEFEVVAYMKNGNVKVSQTYTYNIEKSIGEGRQASDVHTHNNLTVLNSITQSKVNEWDNKADVYHTHNDLATKEEVNGKADINHNHSDLHSHSNKSVLDSINQNKINEWNNKSNFNGDYESLTNKPTIPTPVEVINNLTSTDTNKALSANQGKLLKDDFEKSIYFKGIISNANSATTTGFYKCQQGCANIPVNEYSFLIVYNEPGQYTSIQVWYSVISNKQRMRRYANGSFGDWYTIYTSEEKPTLVELGASSSTHTHNELHTHSNKSVLDGITSDNIDSWNNKLSSETYSFSQNTVSNANDFKSSGYARTSPTTTNLPTGKANWGVIQFIPENANVGQQLYYICSGNDKGKIYVRNLLNGTWADWNRLVFESELSEKANVSHTHDASEITNLPTNEGSSIDFAESHTWTGENKYTNLVTMERNNEVQRMQPANAGYSCYYAFYKNKVNRSGHFGYGSMNNNHFQIANELSGGNINLTVNGGQVQANGKEIATKEYVDNLLHSTINALLVNLAEDGVVSPSILEKTEELCKNFDVAVIPEFE